uniref:Cytochrome P450 n=1 Tax=Glossina morsitans morsitans TaxID=37546 RepID=A0A1B0FQR6_GLOMM
MLGLLILSLFAALIIWDYFYKKERDDILRKSNVSGPKTFPIIGNALEMRNVTTENVFECSLERKRKYGKIHRLWSLNQLSVIVMDVKYIEGVLSSQQIIKKSSFYDILVDWLGRGLVTSSGKKWHTRRRIITPTFHFKILEQFIEIFDQQSTVLVKKMYNKADGKTPINIYPEVSLAALDIITETAMGVKVSAQENPNIEYVRALAHVCKIIGKRFITPIQRLNWLFRLTARRDYLKLHDNINILHKFTDEVIQKRRDALEKALRDGTYEKSSTVEDVATKKRMALLDVLLLSSVNGSPLSNEDIREEVVTFMFAGHDTTTSAMSFILYLISRYPLVQEKLIAEIQNVLGNDNNKSLTYNNLQELKYMECVIKEALRLYPPVASIGRQVTEDLVIEDLNIPAGANVSVPFYLVLRDPDYYDEPDIFKPERFDSAVGQKINPFAFTPFSAGPRNCIGKKFAMLEMKSTVSKMLRHFELLPLGPQVRTASHIITLSVTGVHLGLKPREW